MGGGGSSGGVCIEVPGSLYERLRRLAERSGFGSVSQFAVYLLREAVSQVEEDMLASSEVSEEEKRAIIERLRRLGYL